MKIFIDIGHPAHVHYFKNFIKKMEGKGHQFLVTAREKDITHNLLKAYQLDFVTRGKGSSNFFGKVLYVLKADRLIYTLSRRWKPDCFLSFGSPYAAHVSKIIGRPHIALTDTEHANLGLLAFTPFTETILTPFCFERELGQKQIRFNSYVEFTYLHQNYFKPDLTIRKQLGINDNQKIVLFRFISWGASHDVGQKGIPEETKKELIKLFENKKYKIIVSCEGNIDPGYSQYKINIPPEKIHDVINESDFFIGESGTMATEACILGTPSVFVNSLNAGVFKDEVKKGLLYSFRNADNLKEKIINLVLDEQLKVKHTARKNELIKNKIDLTAFLVWFVENYPHSVNLIKNYPNFQDSFLEGNNLLNSSNKITCSRCILDSTVKDIWFDKSGVCKYCYIHDELERNHPLDSKSGEVLSNFIDRIKLDGKNKKYDCIVGVSGGRDSTFTLLTAKKLGLRPLAVHFDNGWNSNISVSNIEKACKKLNVDLYTVVANWEEFKDLQLSFLKSSTPDADIPTDYAIYSVLYTTASLKGIKYILNGHSFRTEGTSPVSWTYMDPLYIKDVRSKLGTIKFIKSFPCMSVLKLQYYIWFKRIRELRLMEYIDYNKSKVDVILKKELDWEYYGGHHHENHFTKFFQSYYLPVKFKIDKRKTELSALVRSGQMPREDALKIIESQPYLYDQSDIDYVLKKLDLSKEDWQNIMNSEIKSYKDYKTLLPIIKLLKWPIKVATKMKVLPQILYLKYAK